MSDHCSIHQQSIQLPMEGLLAYGSTDHGPGPSRPAPRRQQPRRRRRSGPSRFVALALCALTADRYGCWRGHAFPTSPTSARRAVSSLSSLRMSSLAEPPASPDMATDFQQRMRGLVKRNDRAAARRAADRPANLKTVHTLEEYKEALDEDRGEGRIVVARFFATWCKACKAIQPAYYRMANLHPEITFLEVPVTNHNTNLHQGLEVPSLPFGHVYHPEAGLVEEMKICKKYFGNLVKRVRWYGQEFCMLSDHILPVEEGDDL